MRAVTGFVGLVLALATSLPGQNPPSTSQTKSVQPLAARLLGTWRLISIGSIRADGTLEPEPGLGPHAIGYLMYDATEHMCVSLANPNHPRWVNPEKPTEAERLRSFDVMFAYCGTYEVQEKEQRAIHRPEMASWPHYVGTDQFRNIRMEGDRLILSEKETPPSGELHEYQITWERVKKQGQ
jgi:hypothetical protein